MNEQQQNKVLKGIYNAVIRTMLDAVEDRQRAIYDYQSYLETVERTIQVFNIDFDLEKDLKLVSRGLDESSLRYVTGLDCQARTKQFEFYQDHQRRLLYTIFKASQNKGR